MHRTPPITRRASAPAVLLLLAMTSMIGCTSQRHVDASPSETSQTLEANLHAVTPGMMIGRESFPADAIGAWRAPYVYDESAGGGSDQGCGPITDFWERDSGSHVLASLEATANIRELRYRVDLIRPRNEDHRDLAEVVESCPTLNEQSAKAVRIERKSTEGIPAWATAYAGNTSDAGGATSSSVVAGHYRGIDVYVSASRNDRGSVDADMQVIADMFNAQVARLRAQP